MKLKTKLLKLLKINKTYKINNFYKNKDTFLNILEKQQKIMKLLYQLFNSIDKNKNLFSNYRPIIIIKDLIILI